MKKVTAVILVLIMSLAFSTAALAEEEKSEFTGVRLGAINFTGNDNQQGWASDGHENVASGIPFKIFAAATGISIRLSKAPNPELPYMQLVLGSDGPGSFWREEAFGDGLTRFFVADSEGEGGRLVIPFSAHPGWADFRQGESGRIMICHYDNGGISSLGVVSATLNGVPRALAEELGVPTTGVTTFIGIAALVLAGSGTGAVVVSRKLKNK